MAGKSLYNSCSLPDLQGNRMYDWLEILLDLTEPGVDIFKVSIIAYEDEDESNGKEEKATKGVEKDVWIFKRHTKFTRIVLNSELVGLISSFYGLPVLPGFEPTYPNKPKKSQLSLQSNGCDEGPPTKATPETRTTLFSVGSAEKEMVKHLLDVNLSGTFDSFGSPMKRSSTVAGKSKIEVEISAAKKETGTKLTEDVKSGGTAETKTKSPQTKELKAKASNKLNVNKEPSAQIKSNATDLKAGKETGVEKELKATEKELKATEESDSRKKATATVESDAKIESKAAEESEPRKKVKASKVSDYRKKSTKDSSAKQKFRTTEKSICEKEARVTLDESVVGKGTDNQEEKESSRPGSKNVRTCMTCGLQEPAPKVFKKCKRCKDEDCLNPPYYCGRDCQALDWTARHRQEHEKS